MAEIAFEEAPRKARELFEKGFAAMERGNLDYAMDMFMSSLEIEPRLLRTRKFLRAAAVKKFKDSKGGAITHFTSTLSGLGGLLSVAGWAKLTVDKDSSDAVEKIYKQGKRTVREQYRKDGSHSEYMLILGNGMLVEAKGQNTPFGDIKSAVGAVDLGKLEALQRPAKS